MSASARHLQSCLRQCSKLPCLGLLQPHHAKSTQATWLARKFSTSQCYALVQTNSVRTSTLVQKDVFSLNSPRQLLHWTRSTIVLPNLMQYNACYSTDKDGRVQPMEEKKPESQGTLWQRFKNMYKEYWYVLLPVHCATSVVWYGSFYYIALSGIDIVPWLENMGASEWIVKPLRDTGAGFFAVAYAMYKIATPARYTVTLGGTTITINYLKKWGYIKPMPSSEAMKEMIREKGRQLRSHRAKVLATMNLRRKGSVKTKPSNQNSNKS